VRFALTENPTGAFAEENQVPEYLRTAARQTIFRASDEHCFGNNLLTLAAWKGQ
jgi:aspartate/methionine/tyrosine aminotransferase